MSTPTFFSTLLLSRPVTFQTPIMLTTFWFTASQFLLCESPNLPHYNLLAGGDKWRAQPWDWVAGEATFLSPALETLPGGSTLRAVPPRPAPAARQGARPPRPPSTLGRQVCVWGEGGRGGGRKESGSALKPVSPCGSPPPPSPTR